MKQLFFIVYIFLIVVTGYTQTQSVMYRHWNTDNSAHILYIGNGKNGTFYEYNPPSSKYGLISYGTYYEERNSFSLTSHPEIMLNADNEIPTHSNFSRHTDIDSLCIEIVTPYERTMDYIDSLTYQASIYDGYQRIYRYAYLIKCSDDSLNQAFEHWFNARFPNEKNNRIQVPIPSDVNILSVTGKIFWDSECNDTLLNRSIPYCWSTIQLQNKNENFFHFEFPQFNYFFLSYKRYNQFKVKKISRNKIELDGLIFVRLTKHLLSVEGRKWKRNIMRNLKMEDNPFLGQF